MRKAATAANVTLGVLLGLTGLVFISPAAKAESQQIELGWANLPECTRLTNSGESILGDIVPDTLETAPQRITAYLNLEAPDINSVIANARYCAWTAAAATGLSWIIASPAAAQLTFFASFSACMSSQEWSSLSLSVDTECEW
jgi:hypothetical protein